MTYIERLIKFCETAKNTVPIREIELNAISDLDNFGKSIYVIEQIDSDIEKTFIEFSRYKAKKERACAKLNSPSKIMYVGSSTTGVKKRIEQHLGHGNENTYAIHLSHWFEGSYKIVIKEYDVENEVLQIIEDDLSDRLRPAFGKKGSNNN